MTHQKFGCNKSHQIYTCMKGSVYPKLSSPTVPPYDSVTGRQYQNFCSGRLACEWGRRGVCWYGSTEAGKFKCWEMKTVDGDEMWIETVGELSERGDTCDVHETEGDDPLSLSPRVRESCSIINIEVSLFLSLPEGSACTTCVFYTSVPVRLCAEQACAHQSSLWGLTSTCQSHPWSHHTVYSY